MIILPFTANSILLSTITDKEIQGTAPYLTFDGGTTTTTSVDALIGIKLSDGRHLLSVANPAYPSATVDVSSNDAPIELPSASKTFASIQTLVPFPSAGNADYPSVGLGSLIGAPNNYWKDDNGDNMATATGSLTVKWVDVDGVDITEEVKSNPNTELSACSSPYQLTVTATPGVLSTEYGVPPSSDFTGGTHTYYIKPKTVAPYSCYAQPNLTYGTGEYAGPANQWSPTKGFKFQSFGANFPTTGSDGLSFNLTVAGAQGSDVTATQVSGSSNISLTLTPSGNVVNIKLNGPKYGTESSQTAFSPTTYELYALGTKIYSFTIDKWFIAGPGSASYNGTNNYCKGLVGYGVPKKKDLTNAITVYIPSLGNVGGNYTRAIGGGLFSEWGYTANSQSLYGSSNWGTTNFYWTPEPCAGYSCLVDSSKGQVGYGYWTGNPRATSCVSPVTP